MARLHCSSICRCESITLRNAAMLWGLGAAVTEGASCSVLPLRSKMQHTWSTAQHSMHALSEGADDLSDLSFPASP